MKNKSKSWRYVFIISILLYIIAIIMSMYLINRIPSMYVNAQKNEENKVQSLIESTIKSNNNKDYQAIVDNHFVDLSIYNKTSSKLVYSSLPLNKEGKLMDFYTNDRVVSSKKIINVNEGGTYYEALIIQYYLSPQSTFDIWLKVLGIVIALLLSILLVALSILFYKYVKPLNRLKKTVQQVSAFQLNQINNVNKNTEYDKISNELYEFSKELKDNLNETGYNYNQLEQSLLKQNENISYKNRLLSSLSHDLKAPLSLIRLKLDRDNDENEIRLLQGKIDTLIDDINKINKLAHIDSNISNETTQLDLIEIIAQVNENYYDLLKQKKLYVELEFDEDLTILSNDILIKQVINNAYANMYAHAQIDSEIEIKAYKEQDNIIITFYNECESLSENELENIFELFYGTKNNKISSGMGLSIIKQNINELGGKVSFTNERQGVVLKVVLPCV